MPLVLLAPLIPIGAYLFARFYGGAEPSAPAPAPHGGDWDYSDAAAVERDRAEQERRRIQTDAADRRAAADAQAAQAAAAAQRAADARNADQARQAAEAEAAKKGAEAEAAKKAHDASEAAQADLDRRRGAAAEAERLATEAAAAAKAREAAANAAAQQATDAAQAAAAAAAAKKAADEAAAREADAAAAKQLRDQLDAQHATEEVNKAAAAKAAADAAAAKADADAAAAAAKAAAEAAAREALAHDAAAKQAEYDRRRSLWNALRVYLSQPTADFGSKGHPSAPVVAAQTQSAQGLVPDGIVGPNTRAAALAVGVTLPERRAPGTTPKPTPTGPGGVQPAPTTAADAKAAALTLQTLLTNKANWIGWPNGNPAIAPLQARMDPQEGRGVVVPGSSPARRELPYTPGFVDAWTRTVALALGVKLPDAPGGYPWAQGVVVPPTPPTPPAPLPPHPAPVPTPPPAPVPAPVPPAPAPVPAPAVLVPQGFDPRLAPSLAHDFNRHLLAIVAKNGAQAKWFYDRNFAKKFQTAAGIKSDGLYGGETRGALVFYGQANAPAPFFPPLATVAYKPPVIPVTAGRWR